MTDASTTDTEPMDRMRDQINALTAIIARVQLQLRYLDRSPAIDRNQLRASLREIESAAWRLARDLRLHERDLRGELARTDTEQSPRPSTSFPTEHDEATTP